MISTFAQVKDRILALADNPSGNVFTDAILLQGVGEAVDALQQAFVFYEIPRCKTITTYNIGPNVTNFSPADAGIADMGEVIELREKATGSTLPYTHIWECDDLPQRPQEQILGNWEWRGDDFWFVGATTPRTIWISYFATTEQPTALNGNPTPADGDLTFLSKYAAGVILPRKGYPEDAAVYMKSAVGSRYDEGIIGGELFRLCQPMVRSRQRVQVAPRPYSVIARRKQWRRNVYIAANQPAGVGTAPIQFSSETGTVLGAIDGSNNTFYITFPVAEAVVFRSGVRMTQPTDVVFGANQLVFQPGQIPQIADVITVDGWM